MLQKRNQGIDLENKLLKLYLMNHFMKKRRQIHVTCVKLALKVSIICGYILIKYMIKMSPQYSFQKHGSICNTKSP